ncbi:MAG TPA: VWA domain-containing protein [Bryobacteraceae bacterium]|nr:VWA domain-containing protein [Bryobacteraceae bacterium]
MRRLNKFLFCAPLVCAFTFAQEPPPVQDEIPTFRADTNLVVLHASVVDKSGKLLTNIPQAAFKVFENGVEQTLKIFRREDVPVSMGIIIDNSGSMRGKRASVAAASMDLVKASNPQDEMFIVNFNDDAYLDQPFTSDSKKLEEALDKIDSKGGTAMRDAISMSIDYLKEKGKKDKKVLLVVTDGNDNTSNISLEQLVRKARQTEVLIYSIGLLNEEEPREANKARRALKALADASGAMVYFPKDPAEVDKITPQVAHEIRNQYILAYLPLNANFDGTFRKINVTVKGYGNPTVRTRNGYYATESSAKANPAPGFK